MKPKASPHQASIATWRRFSIATKAITKGAVHIASHCPSKPALMAIVGVISINAAPRFGCGAPSRTSSRRTDSASAIVPTTDKALINEAPEKTVASGVVAAIRYR